jgi:hypothetical protein
VEGPDKNVTGLEPWMSGLEIQANGLNVREFRLTIQKLANTTCLPFASNKLLIVTQGDQPSLATEDAHLPNMIDIHQSASMNSTEARVPQALVQDLKGLGGEVFLVRCDDPHDFSVSLECVDLVGAEQKVFFANSSHDSSRLSIFWLVSDFLKLGQPLRGFPFCEPPSPFDRLGQAICAYGLKQIVDCSRLERLKGILIISSDNYYHRHMCPMLEISNYFKPAHLGHLKIQQHKVGLVGGYFLQGANAIICLSDDFNVVERTEFLAQYFPRYRFVVHDQRSQGHD